ncbi:MAG: hypothetical protein ACTSPO_02580, partial [Candidatus Heimdallarchaeaceae archaeon]
MKLRKRLIVLMLCGTFVLLPVAAAKTDIITYGDIMANFQTTLGGAMAIQCNPGKNEWWLAPLPAPVAGADGRISLMSDGNSYRFEDAHGIYQGDAMQESDLAWLPYFGLPQNNWGLREMLSWFSMGIVLNGVELDTQRTAIKRAVFSDLGAVWWYMQGVLFKPEELARGTYKLEVHWRVDDPVWGLMTL